MSSTQTPPQQSSALAEERTMTVTGHLEELRRRVGVSVLALLLAAGASFAVVGRLIAWLHQPVAGLIPQLAYFSPTEPLVAYVRVAVLAGLILAMPIILGQVWGFVRPGLQPHGRSLGRLFVWWGSLQFIVGAAVAYYVLLPVSLRLLLGIGATTLMPVISLDRYLTFTTNLLFWSGLIFELPVVLCLLAKVGIITAEWLRQQRPYAVLVLVIVAAIATPTTDVANLLLMAVPLLLLYEVSIPMARWVRPGSYDLSSRKPGPGPSR